MRNSFSDIPLNLWPALLLGNTCKLRGIFLKSSRIRDFQERNTKPQISEDSEVGGCELGRFTVLL